MTTMRSNWIINFFDENCIKEFSIIKFVKIPCITLNGNFLVIDDESYGSVFLHFLTEYDARQAHSLLNYVLEHPNVDISNIIPENDDVTPVIYFNATAGTGGDYILYNDGITIGATFSTPYNTFSNGFTFSTSISLSTYGTAGIIQKSNLKDLLIDYVNDDRDGVIELMDSNLIINNSTGVVNSIGLTGSYSLKFDFTDLANNNLQNVVVNLNII